MELLLVFLHVIFLGIFFCVTVGLGAPLLRVLRLKGDDDLLFISISCGLGAWILSQVLMALGFLGVLSRPLLLTLIALSFIFSLVLIRNWAGPLVNLFKSLFGFLRPKSEFFFLKPILFFCLLYLGLCVLALTLPDLLYDSLKYHLYFPRYYLETGSIRFMPHNMLSAFPQNMEMLYMAGLAFGEGVARVPNILATVLSLLLLWSISREMTGKKEAGIFTILSFLTLPVVFEEATHASVDIGSAFYALGSLAAILKGISQSNKRWFFIAGLLSAAGLGVKYLYFIQFISLNLFLCCLWITASKEKRFFLPTPILIFTGTALFFGSFWYLRNYCVTGNPFYPLFYSWFGGPYWSRELEKGLLAVRYQFGPSKTTAHFLLLPLTFLKEGYLFFTFAPLLVFLGKADLKKVRCLAGLCLFEMAVWFFFLTFQIRYAMFGLILSCLILGILLSYVVEKVKFSPQFRWVVTLFLVSLTLVSLREPIATAGRAAFVLLGLKTRENFRIRYVESYAVMKYLNTFLPREAKIASFGDARGYFCERPFFPIHPDVSGYIDLNPMQNAEEYRKRLREVGITHLVYNPRRTEIFRNRYPRWIQLQQELEKAYLKPVRKENGVTLYQLK